MIVECKACHTRFRIDDGKISPRGVKVRCSKCQHTFVVHREEGGGEGAAAAPSAGPFGHEPTIKDTAPIKRSAAADRAHRAASDLFGDEPTKLEKPVIGASSVTQPMFSFNPADIRTSQQAEQFDLDGPEAAEGHSWTERSDPFSLPKRPEPGDNPFRFSEVPPTTPVPTPHGGVATDPFRGQLDFAAANDPSAGDSTGFDIDVVSDPAIGVLVKPGDGEQAFEFDDHTVPIPDPFAVAASLTPAGKAPLPDPFSAAPAAAPAKPAAKQGSERQAATTDPFADAMPDLPPPPPVGESDPFAGIGIQNDPFPDLSEPSPGDVGLAAQPPGPDAGLDPLSPPPGETNPQKSADDLFADLGLPHQLPFEADEQYDNPAVDAATRVHEVHDIQKILKEYSDEADEPVVAAVAAEVAKPESKPERSPARSRVYQVLQGAVGLAVAVGLLLGVYRFRGGLWDELSPGSLLSIVLFGPSGIQSGDLPTRSVQVSYYPLADRNRVVVVVGEVQNSGESTLPGVLVRGTMAGPDDAELSEEVYAGAALDPFDLGPDKSAEEIRSLLTQRAAERGSGLEPGGAWPFAMVFTELPEWVPDAEVQLSARAADAPRAPKPVEESQEVAPAEPLEEKAPASRPRRRAPRPRPKAPAIEWGAGEEKPPAVQPNSAAAKPKPAPAPVKAPRKPPADTPPPPPPPPPKNASEG